MQTMLPVKNLRLSILYLSIAFFIILVLNVSVFVIKTNIEAKNNELNAEAFLEHMESGDFDSAQALWPNVYTTMKHDNDFLDSFSEALSDAYDEYYAAEYKERSDVAQLYEICRVYNSFVDEKSFNDTASGIYGDYLEERIDYDTFVPAINDFYFFTRYESVYISGIIEDGSAINTSRVNFQKALELSDQGNPSEALVLMKKVSPKDSLYYPVAQEKIDSLILQLLEEVKNSK